jgi:hypothetical protein
VFLLIGTIASSYWGQDNVGLAVALNRMVMVSHGVSINKEVGFNTNKDCGYYDDIEDLKDNKCMMFFAARSEIANRDHSNLFTSKNMTSIEVSDYLFDHYARDIFTGIHERCKYIIHDRGVLDNDSDEIWRALCQGRPSDGVNIYIKNNSGDIVQKISVNW